MTERNLTVAKPTPLVPQTIEQVTLLSQLLIKSGLAPRGDNVEAVAVKIMMGLELGVTPFQAVQGFAVINGRVTAFGDMFLAVIQAHPEFQDIKETWDASRKEARCEMHRKGQTPCVRTFSLDQARVAGYSTKPGPWTTHPERMCQMRARGFAGRDLFADALKGLSSAEEQRDIIDITPTAEQSTEQSPAPQTGASALRGSASAQGPVPASEPGLDSLREAIAEVVPPIRKNPKPTMPPNPEADPDQGVPDEAWNQAVELMNTATNPDSLERHRRSVKSNLGKRLSASQKEMLTAFYEELKEYFDQPPEIK